MRHGVKQRKLGRHHNHRKALFLNLKKALINHGSIETTLTKARTLRPMAEKLVTKAKRGKNDGKEVSVSAYRDILKELHQDEVCAKHLINHVVTNYANRPGGYTRIVKGRIKQDKTTMAIIEFVDFRKAS